MTSISNTTTNTTVAIASAVGYQFADGEQLFDNLSFSLDGGVTALIGRNGVGKSLLAELLSGQRQASSGEIKCHGTVAFFNQVDVLSDDSRELTLCEYLGVAEILGALNRVANGSCDPKDFDLIGDNWQLTEQLQEELRTLGITVSLDDACSTLSGGQLVRLMLWNLFRQQVDLLILDEPSNHLDAAGRQWLQKEMKAYPYSILVVSHDRMLLRQASTFLRLGDRGISSFSGSYDAFVEKQRAEAEALAKKKSSLERQRSQLKRQQKISTEKAARRARQGKKLRDGSQPKELLNAKKESAESAQSGLAKQHRRQRDDIEVRLQAVKEKQENNRPISMSLSNNKSKGGRLLTMANLVLPRGSDDPITRVINAHDKIHIKGDNGAGKTTLLEIVLGKMKPVSGEIQSRADAFYLDQHYSQLSGEESVLNNLMRLSDCANESVARTLLASVGFSGERVMLPVAHCSGGEKMKVAMLAISKREGKALLLLDEPDNHLDMESKQLLAQALADYQGSYLLVTHDEDFALEAGCNEYLELLLK